MADELQGVTELLFERGTLVDLHIGKPTFQRKLKQDDLLLEGIDEGAIYLGHKKLLPKEAIEPIAKIEARARESLFQRSLAFPVSGARFVKNDTLPDVLGRLREFKTQWDAQIRKLMEDYETLQAQQLAALNRQNLTFVEKELEKVQDPAKKREKERFLETWVERQDSLNQSLYLKVDELPSHFPFTWSMFKVSGVGLSETDETFLEAQEQLKRDLQLWVRRATMEMHQKLGEAALNAKNVLEKNGSLEPRNLRPLFRAFETFSSVDFTGKSSFQAVIDEIKSKFGMGENLEQTSFEINANMGGFRELLEGVARLAHEQVAEQAGLGAIARTGEFSRVVEL